MKGRYSLVGLVAFTVVLGYAGTRYQAQRRVELTAQLRAAMDADEKARAIHLLQLGANANAKDKDGTPLVFSALDIEDASVLKAFIAAGADVNVTSKEDGATVTLLSKVGHYAESLYPAQIQEMKMLLEAGANPNLGSESILSANAGSCGHCGACWSNPQEVALLVKHGAKLRKGDAASILETALYSDVEDSKGPSLLRVWATLPVPARERRAVIAEAIKHVGGPKAQGEDDATLAFLRHELRKTQTGSQQR